MKSMVMNVSAGSDLVMYNKYGDFSNVVVVIKDWFSDLYYIN